MAPSKARSSSSSNNKKQQPKQQQQGAAPSGPSPEELALKKRQEELVAQTMQAMELKVADVRVPDASITFSSYSSDSSLPAIMKLVEKDLSEPYSIFTYRYFVLGWPELTILAKEGDELLGVIVCKVDRVNRRKRLRGYIAMLAVEQSHRKRGIGSYLAYQAIMRMKDDFKCDEVVLETELTNQGALSLYERLGFVRDKRLHRYYLNGGDAFRLKLWFTSPSWNDQVLVEETITEEAPAVAAEPAAEPEVKEPEVAPAAAPASSSKKKKTKA